MTRNRTVNTLAAILYWLTIPFPASAIVIRHDVPDSSYTNLGNSIPNAIWVALPGDPAAPNSFFFASGTLIAPDWALISAHHVDLLNGALNNVRLGNGGVFDQGLLVVGADEIIQHPVWNGDNHRDGVDIALVKLSRPVSVSPMNRHSDSVASLVGDSVTLVGYGRTGTGITGHQSDSVGVKRGGTNVIDRRGGALGASYSDDLILLDFDGPGGIYPNRWGSATPTSLEAASGPGDSGGSWIVNGRLAGVHSFGQDGVYGDYSGATAVQPHRDWINDTMGGVNWNSRGTNVPFNTPGAWGDGQVPTGDVRFSVPLLGTSVPSISFSQFETIVRNFQVDFGPHEFNAGFNDITATGPITVDNDGTMIFAGGFLHAVSNGRLRIGRFSTGRFKQDGGHVFAANNVTLGENAGSNGVYQLDSGSLTVGNNNPIEVGRQGTGQFNQNGGRVDAPLMYVGRFAGSNGLFENLGGVTDLQGALDVGRDGVGAMRIQSGGTVSNSNGTIGVNNGSIGSATVAGAASTWFNGGFLNVGESGLGTLTISNGGNVSSNTGSLATMGGSTGTVTVTGLGSSWANSGKLSVGTNATGTLTISAGGKVFDETGHVGDNEDGIGRVFVTGQGSTWDNSNQLFVGRIGEGTLDVRDRGRVISGPAYIAYYPQANSAATVSGAGSNWSNRGLVVGHEGSGFLTISDGGIVTSTSGVSIARDGTSVGLARVFGNGSNWTTTEELSIGGNASTGVNGGTGTLEIGAGGRVDVAEDIVLFPGGIARLQGGLLATNSFDFRGGEFQWTSGELNIMTFSGDLANAAGTLSPRQSVGSVLIFGDYEQHAAAALKIEIGGLIPEFDLDIVSIHGSALLGGNLKLALNNGFAPNANDTFAILSAFGGIVGTFSNAISGMRVFTESGDASFLVHYGPESIFDPNEVVLSSFEFAGDYDRDKTIGPADYEIWRSTFGSSTDLRADGNFDGIVDAADYTVWRDAIAGAGKGTPPSEVGAGGGAAPGAGSLAQIPEPTAAALATAGLILCGLAIRRRR